MLNISVNKIAVNFGNNAVSKPQLKLKPALSADVFVKSSPSAPKLYAVPYTKPVSFKGQTVDSISRAVKFGSPFSTPLIQRYDGGYLVDSSTNTVVYYGKDAKNYLKDMTHFPLETQIIAQSDTEIEVETMQGKKINLDEPGAILINKDTFAKVKVKKGNPLVITTQNTPPWFQKMSAERQDYFNTLVGKNKNAFDTNHPTQNPGTALRKDFEACPDWVFDKLCEKKILIKDESDTNKAKWASFRTVDEFQEDLWNKAEIYGDVKDRIVDTYKKTTKAGYDFTGLKDSADGVTVYVGKDRFNLFNSNPTEWLSSSITWGDKGTFGIGVSRVARQGSSEITDFNEIRPSEKIHKHQNPQKKDETQTEIYLLTQGRAAFCTLENSKKKVSIINAGDLVVIPPDCEHGIVAIDGEYEHLCSQSPSTFHYGFEFKNVVADFDPELKQKAIEKLRETKSV